MTRFAIILIGACLCLCAVANEEVVGKSVASFLRECYNNTETRVKDYQAPSTMNELIDMIRKTEINRQEEIDLREQVLMLLHRFRQDGIEKSKILVPGDVLPYSPKGMENHKFRILMKSLIPKSNRVFQNESLHLKERCSFHNMISVSIDDTERGDENFVCSALGKFQTRNKRATSDDDVEVFDKSKLEADKAGNFVKDPNSESVNIPGTGRRAPPPSKLSSCPLENGAVYTRWGAVSGGNLLAGIAAGTAPQKIPINSLTDRSNSGKVDVKFAATLAGDLAETALYKYEYAAEDAASDVEVGAEGGWNSTTLPKYYFISKNKNYDMTDAEIRGGLDGLILASVLDKEGAYGALKKLKLSQLLDMYYSERGFWKSDIKACRRKLLMPEYAPEVELVEQATNFALVLDKEVQLEVTFQEDQIANNVKQAVANLISYLPQNLADKNCMPDDNIGTAAQLIILLDCNWPYDIIYPALSYLLDNVEISPFNSNFTILNAQDGSVIVNNTQHISDFHTKFNRSVYENQNKGFKLGLSIKWSEEVSLEIMANESMAGSTKPGGKSLVSIFVPYSVPTDESDRTYAINRLNDIRLFVPDYKLLILSKDSISAFNFLSSDSKDLFVLNENAESSSIVNSLNPLVERIKQVPKRLINPKCGADWKSSGNNKQMVEYVTSQGINYYRLHQNYFYGQTDAYVQIKGEGYGPLNVCHSRTNPNPRGSNSSSSAADVTCKQITSDTYKISLSNACDEGYLNDCNPLYVSVEAPQKVNSNRKYNCMDDGCRYPDDLKYTFSFENLGCVSGTGQLLASISIITAMLFIALLRL